MSTLLIVLILFPVALEAIYINFYDCAGLQNIKYIKIKGCPAEPCAIIPGQEFSLEMKFRPPKYAEKAKLVIFADFYGYKVTLLTIDNFCGYYGFECPLDPGVLHTLQLKQYVSKYFWLPMPLYSQLGVKLMSRAKSGILACATFQLGFNANGHYDHDEL